MTATIFGTATDYKKYLFAQGQSQIWRAQEIVDAIERNTDTHPEITQDLSYMLDSVMQFLWHAAFVDADQAAAEEGRGRPRARRPGRQPRTGLR